jgi:GT2 family glycosyltransferase
MSSEPAAPVAAARAKEPLGPDSGRVVVIILNWNAGEHLLRCVQTVRESLAPEVRVVVIDNASSDGSIERVEGISGVEVVRNPSNLGFAAAYNQGILASKEEFVVLLNPDVMVKEPQWLKALLAKAEEDPRRAAVACKLLFAHDARLVNSAGGMAFWWTGPVDVGFGEPDEGALAGDLAPFAPSGGAMLVRREVFASVGGFDGAMFAYVEDFDLGWRLRLSGWNIGYAPRAVFTHVFSATTGPLSPRRIYLSHRNFLRAMLKNYSRRTLARAVPAYLLWTAAKSLGGAFGERSVRLAAAPLRGVGWNLLNLGDTMRLRRSIQSTRVVDDAEILKAMGPRGFEPLSSLQRRRRIAHDRTAEGTR